MARVSKLGDRVKRYELEEAGRRMVPRHPILARLDGRAFHTFTRGLARPYSKGLSQSMINTMLRLVNDWNATLGYTQSDEILLYWANTDPKAEMQFDGRYQKWVSLLAADCTLEFYKQVQKLLPEKSDRSPKFDCRVWQVPNEEEVYHNFLWREDDASVNSIQMAAQAQFSHKELHRRGWFDLNQMLFDRGINWNDYPAFFKRGTYGCRLFYDQKISPEDRARIPELANFEGDTVVRKAAFPLTVPPLRALAHWSDLFGIKSKDEELCPGVRSLE